MKDLLVSALVALPLCLGVDPRCSWVSVAEGMLGSRQVVGLTQDLIYRYGLVTKRMGV